MSSEPKLTPFSYVVLTLVGESINDLNDPRLRGRKSTGSSSPAPVDSAAIATEVGAP